MPESLSGAPSAAAFESLREFAITAGRKGARKEDFSRELQRLYALERDGLRGAASHTFEALQRIEAIDTKATPANGAVYDPKYPFAQGLRQIAQLIRADVGLDAASVDLGGWDTHFTQESQIEPLMLQLASGLDAFRRDLGPRLATTTVVVMTEFGRRVAENSAFGTDHGRGGAMFVLGGGVKGGRVLGGWPGLKPEMLEGPGDLPVWNNYRDILAPIAHATRRGSGQHGANFPGLRTPAAAALFVSDEGATRSRPDRAATARRPYARAADARSAFPNPRASALACRRASESRRAFAGKSR